MGQRFELMTRPAASRRRWRASGSSRADARPATPGAQRPPHRHRCERPRGGRELVRVGDAGVWVGAAGRAAERPSALEGARQPPRRLHRARSREAHRGVGQGAGGCGRGRGRARGDRSLRRTHRRLRARPAGRDRDRRHAGDRLPRRRRARGRTDRARHGRDDRARPDAEQARHRPARRGCRGGEHPARLRGLRAHHATDADEIHFARPACRRGCSRSRRATCTPRARSVRSTMSRRTSA